MATTTPIPDNHGIFTIFFRNSQIPREMAITCGYVWSDISIANPDAICTTVRDAFATVPGAMYLPANMLTGWSINRIETYFRTIDGDLVQGSNNSIVSGAKSGAGLIVNSSIKVKKRTAFAGRRYRGYFYSPPTFLVEGDLGVDGEISNANLITLNAAWGTARTTMRAQNVRPVILHSWAGIPTPLPPAPTEITAFEVKSRVGTMGRRMRF